MSLLRQLSNFIAKASYGMADDMLTTTFLAANCTKLVVPAMNTQMFLNPITQGNIMRFLKVGIRVMQPSSGALACGDVGVGKMPEPEAIWEEILFDQHTQKTSLARRFSSPLALRRKQLTQLDISPIIRPDAWDMH